MPPFFSTWASSWCLRVLTGDGRAPSGYLRRSWAKAPVPFVTSPQRSLCHLLHDLWVRNKALSPDLTRGGKDEAPPCEGNIRKPPWKREGKEWREIWAKHLFPVCSWRMLRYVHVFLHQSVSLHQGLMAVCVCVCISILCECVCVWILVNVCICIGVSFCVYVYMWMCIYESVSVYYVSVCVDTCECMYMCRYKCL